MNTSKATLQFEGYHVEKMSFSEKREFPLSSLPIEIAPQFARQIYSRGNGRYEISIGVRLDQEELPFVAELVLNGRFHCDDEQNASKILKLNGMAILYPYVRSTLSFLTSLAGIPPVVLPTINLAKMFENEDDSLSKKDQKQ